MRKKLGLFWFAAALLGAALIFAGCPTEAETETVTVTKGMAVDVPSLQKLLDTEGVNYVEFVGNLEIGGTDSLVIPAGKTVKVDGNVTVASSGGNKGLLAVVGTLTLTGTITNDGIVIGSDDFIRAVGGDTYGIVASLPATAADDDDGVVAIKDLTLGAATEIPAGLTVYVYGTLKVDTSSAAPTTGAKVVAIGYVEIAAATVATALSDNTKVDVSNAILKNTVAATVTLPVTATLRGIDASAAALTIAEATTSLTTGDLNGNVTLPTALTAVRVSGGTGNVTTAATTIGATRFGNTGTISFTGASATFSGATHFAGATSFTGNAAFTLAANFIRAVKFGGTATFSGTVGFGGDVTVTTAKDITLSANAVNLAGGVKIIIHDATAPATVLTATVASVLTPGGNAKLTPAIGDKKLTLTVAGLTLTGGPLTVAAGAELALGAVLTVSPSASLVLTGAASTGGAKLSGSGGVKAGETTITGAWQAVGTAGTVTIASASATASSITASATTVAFTAGASGTITQAAVASTTLTIAEDTTIALGGDKDAAVGAIVLTGDDTNPAVLTLIGTITGDTSLDTPVAAADIEIENAELDGTNAIAGTTDDGTNNNLGSLIGAASSNTITAGGSGDDVTINAATIITSP